MVRTIVAASLPRSNSSLRVKYAARYVAPNTIASVPAVTIDSRVGETALIQARSADMVETMSESAMGRFVCRESSRVLNELARSGQP